MVYIYICIYIMIYIYIHIHVWYIYIYMCVCVCHQNVCQVKVSLFFLGWLCLFSLSLAQAASERCFPGRPLVISGRKRPFPRFFHGFSMKHADLYLIYIWFLNIFKYIYILNWTLFYCVLQFAFSRPHQKPESMWTNCFQWTKQSGLWGR